MLAASAGREQQPTADDAQQSTNCDFLCEKLKLRTQIDARLPRPSTTFGPRPSQNRQSLHPREHSLPHFSLPHLSLPACLLRQSTGKGADLSPLVAFYSKLPKGPASEPAVSGIKARYFNGKNASASPIVFTVLALFGLGYTLDYQSAWPLTVS